ncbi:MAG: protein phosphatase 2C domain-containing protein [Tannerellaceae bacterium]|jgi:serine/threonine protein phosphatase PrpC|nr:protein phosphatase 2C domain-containing protein [Tannerellaceae bacterium]
MIHTELFNYGFLAAASVNIGQKRTSNQDEVILCHEAGFYAVSDGMGGLSDGGKTSGIIKQILPGMLQNLVPQCKENPQPEHIAALLEKQVQTISDTIYNTSNKGRRVTFGATLSGVWLIGSHAVFVNLGDSRGYVLPRYKKNIRQITHDHNVAAILVQQGELSKEEARSHPSSCSLTRFAGMPAPATPEAFICNVEPGDRILLCSDGLYGMTGDEILPQLMRSSRNPERICSRLIEQANASGGNDNISVVYLKIT